MKRQLDIVMGEIGQKNRATDSFVLKEQVKNMPPLGGGIELCGISSCLGGLTSWLNIEGILTLPMFLLRDGSLI